VTRAAAAAALLVAAALAAGGGDARAQTAAEQLARGVRATHDLEFDSAAAALRDALGRTGEGGLDPAGRARALAYLGATELFRERRDSAIAAFRRLVLLTPRYRFDQLTFPPEVTGLYDEVRLGTRAVAIEIAPETRIAAAGDRLVARLFGSAYHEITVTVVPPGAAPPRTIYAGAIGDSLEVLWDARDPGGTPVAPGAWLLRVASRGSAGSAGRTVEVPLDVRLGRGDTVPYPPPPADSLLAPERTSGGSGRGLNALLAGLAGGAATALLPSLVAGGSDHAGARFAVAGAFGVAAIAGFVLGSRPQPIPRNVEANDRLRRAWTQQVETVRAENAQRRRQSPLVIHAAPMRVAGGGR